MAELETLRDADLWRAAETRLPAEASERLEALHFKRRDQGLSEDEKSALAGLLRQYERTMLVRAKAAQVLEDRGHDVSVLLSAS